MVLQIPPESSPLLPYFASLSLIISFCFWVGYIILISKNDEFAPRMQRQIVVRASVGGKLILAAAHAAISYRYKMSFPDSKQPDWMLMFLAAQAWWDVCLIAVVKRCLQLTEVDGDMLADPPVNVMASGRRHSRSRQY
jgi:hypothetical protein